MTFTKITKTKKLPQKHPKSRNSKSHIRRPEIKKFRKQAINRIEKY